MMNPWESIVTALGGTSVLLIVLGFLARSIIVQWLSKNLNEFKTNLTTESSKEVEELKSQLKIAAIEHEIRFSSLHAKRAEVIAELYSLLAQAMWNVQSFVSPTQLDGEPSKQEKYQQAMKSLVKMIKFFDRHKIFLPEKLCPAVEHFIEDLRDPTIDFNISVSERDNDDQKALISIWKKVEQNAPPARAALECEFRSLLGMK